MSFKHIVWLIIAVLIIGVTPADKFNSIDLVGWSLFIYTSYKAAKNEQATATS